MIERAEIIRDKGTNRKQFIRGKVDKYTWVDIGGSYVPSELCCAFLYGQLELLDEISTRRREVYQCYRQLLKPLEAEGLLRLPCIPEDCASNYHMFYLLVADRAIRDALIEHLGRQGIQAVFHYVPLHSSPMGATFGYRDGQFPETERVSSRLLRLPLHYDITAEQQGRVVEAIKEYFSGRRGTAASSFSAQAPLAAEPAEVAAG